MKSKRVFTQEASDLFRDNTGRKLSGNTLMHEWKSSEVWQHFDMLDYRLTDADKMPMVVWDSGEVFSDNDKAEEYLLECFVSYSKTALVHAQRLCKALEVEIKNGEKILQEKEEDKKYLNILNGTYGIK